MTMAEIAAHYGVTKQAVSSRIGRVATPADRAANRSARTRLALKVRAERAAAIHAAREAGPRCALPWCNQPARGQLRTCSPECAADWKVLRRYFDEAAYLAHRLHWAKPGAEPGRRWRVPGSRADLILKAHGL